jgi:hypothetical protein
MLQAMNNYYKNEGKDADSEGHKNKDKNADDEEG